MVELGVSKNLQLTSTVAPRSFWCPFKACYLKEGLNQENGWDRNRMESSCTFGWAQALDLFGK